MDISCSDSQQSGPQIQAEKLAPLCLPLSHSLASRNPARPPSRQPERRQEECRLQVRSFAGFRVNYQKNKQLQERLPIKKKVFKRDQQLSSLAQLSALSPLTVPSFSAKRLHSHTISVFNMEVQHSSLLELQEELLQRDQFVKEDRFASGETGFQLILCTSATQPKFIEDHFIVCRFEQGKYFLQQKCVEREQIVQELLYILRSRFFLHVPKWRTGLLWIYVPDSLKAQSYLKQLKSKFGDQVQICSYSSVSKVNPQFLKAFKAAVLLTSYKQLQHFEQLTVGRHREQVALYLLTQTPHKLNINFSLQGVCHSANLILSVIQKIIEPQFSLKKHVSQPLAHQVYLEESSLPAMRHIAHALANSHQIRAFDERTLLPASAIILVLHYFKANYFLKVHHEHPHAILVIYSPSPSLFLESFRLIKNLVLVSNNPQEIVQRIADFKTQRSSSKIKPIFRAVQVISSLPEELSQNLRTTLANSPKVITFRSESLLSIHRIMVPTVVVADGRTVLRLSLSENRMVVFIEFGSALRENSLDNIVGRALNSSQVLQIIQEIAGLQSTGEQVLIDPTIQPFLQAKALSLHHPQASEVHTLILSELELRATQSKDYQSQLVVLARHPSDYMPSLRNFERLKMVVGSERMLSKLKIKLEKGISRIIDKVIYDQFSFQKANQLKLKVASQLPGLTLIPLYRLDELELYWQDTPLIVTANPSAGRVVEMHNRCPFSRILLLSNCNMSLPPFLHNRNYFETVKSKNLVRRLGELLKKQRQDDLLARAIHSHSVHRVCRPLSNPLIRRLSNSLYKSRNPM